MLAHVLMNLLTLFFPSALALTAALIGIKGLKRWRRFVIWANSCLFVLVLMYSFLSLPPEDPLKVEWAFYALRVKPDATYDLCTLLGDEEPPLLGIETSLSEIAGLPIVRSADQAQMRVRLNRRGYVHVFHFDTTSLEIRQLFPSADSDSNNPVHPDVWAGFPSGNKSWRFDQQPGIEAFVVLAGTNEGRSVLDSVKSIIQEEQKAEEPWTTKMDRVGARLRNVARCDLDSSGEYVHDLVGVWPAQVRTYTYAARDGKFALLIQLVRHLS